MLRNESLIAKRKGKEREKNYSSVLTRYKQALFLLGCCQTASFAMQLLGHKPRIDDMLGMPII